jgi:ankyrin repeat protein
MTFTQQEANDFIIKCHFDLETVKSRLAVEPGLANAYNPETIESALGAAGHVGNETIAKYLLANGAKPELAASAMLGERDMVEAAIARDPKLATSGGAHNISIAFHAALSGDVQMMQVLWDAGAQEQVKQSLLGAVMKNRLEMAKWLIDHGAATDIKDFQGRSALEVAEQSGFSEMADLLRGAG